jgi:hypothetical protein
VKSLSLTEELLSKLIDLSVGGVSGILGGAVECVDIKRNAGGESDLLDNY